jgi:hypothetical protein
MLHRARGWAGLREAGVQGFEFKVKDSGFNVKSLGSKIWGSGFTVSGLGFQI